MAYSGSLLRDIRPVMSQWHNLPAELHMRVLLSHHLSLVSAIKARLLERVEVIAQSRVDDDV